LVKERLVKMDASADFPEFASLIQASIRAATARGCDQERVGSFLATFNREDNNPYLNYAIPDDGAAPSRAEIDALAAAYRMRDRRPRLEYIPLVAPAVEPALLRAGFSVEQRTPLMTCTAALAVQHVVVEGIEFVVPASEDDYRAAASVQWEAYEERGDVPQRAVDALRRAVDAGGVVILARDPAAGQPAGAGLCTAPTNGLSELASVGVRASFRHRGIAGAMTGFLAERAFASGVTCVFLMAHGEPEARIYTRAGFKCRSEVLHISHT
jgi:ribosomal protein S18 acetylase RimI-like enzyme